MLGGPFKIRYVTRVMLETKDATFEICAKPNKNIGARKNTTGRSIIKGLIQQLDDQPTQWVI